MFSNSSPTLKLILIGNTHHHSNREEDDFHVNKTWNSSTFLPPNQSNLSLTILDDCSLSPRLQNRTWVTLPQSWRPQSSRNLSSHQQQLPGFVSALIPVLLLRYFSSWHVGLIRSRLAWIVGWFGRISQKDSSRVDDVDQRTRQKNLLGKRNYMMNIGLFWNFNSWPWFIDFCGLGTMFKSKSGIFYSLV